MKLPKQDRNGVRTPTDIERRYPLGVLDEIGDTETRLEDLEKNKVDSITLYDLDLQEEQWTGENNSNTSERKLIGYCGNNIDVNIAAGQMARLGGGTTLPKAVFGDSKYIVGARVYIGAAATDTKIFISADLTIFLYRHTFF